LTASLHIVFKVAGAEYVIPAEQVLQMESFTGATRVPGAPPYVAGIVQIRSTVIPVVDLRMRFGLPSVEHTLDSRIVVGKVAGRSVGLLVDSAREVLKLSEAELSAPPSLVTNQAEGFVKAVARPGARMLLLIDFEKVIGEENLHGN
jgi:purine-binding chemotaxis protein CheW